MKLELEKITKMSVLTLITVAALLSACNDSPVANEDTTESDVKAGSQTELVLASDVQ